MKLYKLKSLIYFFLYKLNRWFGGKTKWDIQDWQCISADWEHCMMLNEMSLFQKNLTELCRSLGKELLVAFNMSAKVMLEFKKTIDKLDYDENSKEEQS